MKRIFPLFLMILVLGLNGCGKPEKESGERAVVVTSVYPLYDIARNIAGDTAEVEYAIPAGANPHTYAPTLPQVRKIQKGKVYIGVHPGFDGWVKDYLSKTASHYYLMEEEHEEEHPHGEGEETEHEHGNPHIWLSVKNAQNIAVKFWEILCDIDPTNREAYSLNSANYQATLSELDGEIGRMMKDISKRKVIQWHPAWDYFAQDYGLEIAGTIETGHGKEPSVKAMQELIGIAKNEAVGAIIVDLNAQSKAAETLSRETGVPIVRLDTLGKPGAAGRDTYVNLMRDNALRLKEALR